MSKYYKYAYLITAIQLYQYWSLAVVSILVITLSTIIFLVEIIESADLIMDGMGIISVYIILFSFWKAFSLKICIEKNPKLVAEEGISWLSTLKPLLPFKDLYGISLDRRGIRAEFHLWKESTVWLSPFFVFIVILLTSIFTTMFIFGDNIVNPIAAIVLTLVEVLSIWAMSGLWAYIIWQYIIFPKAATKYSFDDGEYNNISVVFLSHRAKENIIRQFNSEKDNSIS